MNLDSEPRTLAELRVKLAHLRADVRDAEASFEVAQARAEADVIDERYQSLKAEGKDFETDSKGNRKPVDPLGSNEAERKRNLIIGLSTHPGYLAALNRLNATKGTIDLLVAAITSKEEEQRERERLTRQELVDALLGRHLDDAMADMILDLAHPARPQAHRTSDRAREDAGWSSVVRQEMADLVADCDIPTVPFDGRLDHSHADITEAILGEVPPLDPTTMQWGLAAKAERERQQAESARLIGARNVPGNVPGDISTTWASEWDTMVGKAAD